MKNLFKSILPLSIYERLRKYFWSMRHYLSVRGPVTITMPEFPHRSFNLRGVGANSTMDRSIWIYGLYEPFMVSRITGVTGPHDTFFDIGAGIGYYSKLFSEIICSDRVTAFEPENHNLRFLRRNVDRRVQVVKKFVTGGSNSASQISLDTFIAKNDEPTVIKMDIEGREADIIICSDYIKEYRPRMFVEIHPSLIDQINPKYLEQMFDRLFSIYTVEFVRNHWGSVKTPGSLSVIDEPGCYDWGLADHDNLLTISKDIIHRNIQPKGFGIHCFCRLEDLIES